MNASRGTVYRGGTVVTGEQGLGRPTALWIVADRIEMVGSDVAVTAAAGADAGVVSLQGRTVLPGLIDAHCHVTWLGYLLGGADCSPAAAPTIGALQEQLSRADPGADGWVTGSGYAEYELEEGRAPTRDELDAAVPGQPCVVYQTSMHTCVVNSLGLRRLGLTDASPDPERGRLGRDAAGRLDGRLFEAPTFDLVQANLHRHVRETGDEGRIGLFTRAGGRLASLGITSATDASTDADAFEAMHLADRTGRLPIRLRALFTYPEAGRLLAGEPAPGGESAMVRVGGVKIWADGGMSSRTAAVDEPYLEPAGETGILWHEADGLAGMIGAAQRAGLQAAIHAQGERAIGAVLEALGSVAGRGNPLRHRIEHGGAFRPHLRRRAAEVGVHVVSQPGFLSQLGDGFVAAFGPERSGYLYPFASLAAAGVVVAGSSDAPVIDPNPFLGMRDAVLRRTRRGVDLAPLEALPVEEALALYTSRAAFVGGDEDTVGTLAAGKLADFVVVDRDPLHSDVATLHETRVHCTVVAGRVVFSDGSIVPGPSGAGDVPR